MTTQLEQNFQFQTLLKAYVKVWKVVINLERTLFMWISARVFETKDTFFKNFWKLSPILVSSMYYDTNALLNNVLSTVLIIRKK